MTVGHGGPTPPPRSRSTRKTVAVLVHQEILDDTRRRRALVVRGLTPILLLGALLGLAALTSTDTEVGSGYTVAVAVMGDPAGAAATLGFLEADERVRVEVTDDLPGALADGADVGVTLPADLDAVFTAGETPTIVVDWVNNERRSRTASILVRSSLDAARRDLGAGADRPVGIQPEVEGVTDDDPRPPQSPGDTLALTTVEPADTATADLAARGIVALVVLQGVMLVGGAASRFVSRRQAGLLVPHLLLPVPRSMLVQVRGLAELGVGTLTSAPFLVLALVGALAVGLSRSGAAAGVIGVVAVTAGWVALAGLLVAAGLLVGVRSRSPESAAILSSLAVAAVAITVNLVVLGGSSVPPVVGLVPLVGTAAGMVGVLSGEWPALWLVPAVAVDLLLALGLTLISARGLGHERVALRVS